MVWCDTKGPRHLQPNRIIAFLSRNTDRICGVFGSPWPFYGGDVHYAEMAFEFTDDAVANPIKTRLTIGTLPNKRYYPVVPIRHTQRRLI